MHSFEQKLLVHLLPILSSQALRTLPQFLAVGHCSALFMTDDHTDSPVHASSPPTNSLARPSTLRTSSPRAVSSFIRVTVEPAVTRTLLAAVLRRHQAIVSLRSRLGTSIIHRTGHFPVAPAAEGPRGTGAGIRSGSTAVVSEPKGSRTELGRRPGIRG